MTAEEVLTRYFECLSSESYSEAADLLTQKALERFREFHVPQLRPRERLTAEDYMAQDPKLPREAAEYRVEQLSAHPTPTWRDYFAGVDSEADLEALSDAEVYARRLAATDPEARYRRHLDTLIERYPEHEAQLREMRNREGGAWRCDVLGSVETHGRTFVLFGQLLDDEAMRFESVPHVAVLRLTDRGWRLAADPSPYSGLIVGIAPVMVTGPNGEKIELDPNAPA